MIGRMMGAGLGAVLLLASAMVGAAPARAADPYDEAFRQEVYEQSVRQEHASQIEFTVPLSTDPNQVGIAATCTLLLEYRARYEKPALSFDITESGESAVSTPDCGGEFWTNLFSYVAITHSGAGLGGPKQTEDSNNGPPPGPIVARTSQVVGIFAGGYYGWGSVITWDFEATGFAVDGRRLDLCARAEAVYGGPITSEQVPCT